MQVETFFVYATLVAPGGALTHIAIQEPDEEAVHLTITTGRIQSIITIRATDNGHVIHQSDTTVDAPPF
jgi:hypothetical protein